MRDFVKRGRFFIIKYGADLDFSIYEIIDLSKQNLCLPHLFTEDQERLLASEVWIMSFFRMIVMGLVKSELKTNLKISEKEFRLISREFEKVGLA